MDDSELDKRIAKVDGRLRVCYFVAWPSLIIGAAFLLGREDRVRLAAAIAFLCVGVAARVYSYMLRSERRSLKRIWEEMSRNASLFLAVGLVLLAGNVRGAEIAVGAKATELGGLEWVEGSLVKIFDKDGGKADNRLFLVVLWGAWDKNSRLIFQRLADIRDDYSQGTVAIVAVSTERRPAVEKFLLGLPGGKAGFGVALDPERKVASAYAGEGAGIPLAVIVGSDGTILWRGEPAAMYSVLKKVVYGGFDSKTQAEISALRERLREFLHIDDLNQIVRLSEKILELDPSDELAMRLRIYVFERTGKLKDALSFVEKIISGAPDAPGPRLTRLDLMTRLGVPIEKRREEAGKIFERFKDNPEALTRLSWILVANMRFGETPLKTALAASSRAVELLEKRQPPPAAELAGALEVAARASYLAGRVADAVKIQEKVVGLRTRRFGEAASERLLEYYRDAERLSK